MCKNAAITAADMRPKPLIGLRNLGNTCYLNSALQCLRAVSELSVEFLTNRYKSQLNCDNPLGKGGKLAEAYGNVMRSVIFHSGNAFSPKNFIISLHRLFSEFNPLQQHDAHELVSMLLDGLHEDLNLILKKPYVQLQDDDGKRPDDDIAMEHWRNHLRRNQGILVDLFHGQYKSTLVCPECDYTARKGGVNSSATEGKEGQKETSESNSSANNEDSSVPRTGGGHSPGVSGPDPSRMVVAALRSRRFLRVYGNGKPLSKISDLHLHVYTLDSDASGGNEETEKEGGVGGEEKPSSTELFGHPFLLEVPGDESVRRLYARVCTALRRSAPKLANLALSRSSAADDDGDDDDDGGAKGGDGNGDPIEKKTKENGEAQQSNHHYPFKLSISNSSGTKRGKVLWENRGGGEAEAALCEFLKIKQTLCMDFQDGEERKWVNEIETVMYEPRELPSTSDGVLSVSDCFRSFCTAETLGGANTWYCSRCKKHVPASKKMEFFRLPTVLVVHLNRFEKVEDPAAMGGRLMAMLTMTGGHKKNGEKVRFPLHGFDMAPFTHTPADGSSHSSKSDREEEGKGGSGPPSAPLYDLVAVCNHHGAANFGHYTAFVKAPRGAEQRLGGGKGGIGTTSGDRKDGKAEETNSSSSSTTNGQAAAAAAKDGLSRGSVSVDATLEDEEAWYHIDDDVVKEVADVDTMQHSDAYLLFYRRRAMMPESGEYEEVERSVN
eukprot:jgi/Bigna1/130227/aug1.10_g4935